jgi:hypothetical protein
MLVCAFPREAFHCGGTDHFGHSQVAPHSLPGLFSLSASARCSPAGRAAGYFQSGQEIRSQDNLFATTARAAYPPLAPAVSIGPCVSDNFQADEKFPSQIVESPHSLLPLPNKDLQQVIFLYDGSGLRPPTPKQLKEVPNGSLFYWLEAHNKL